MVTYPADWIETEFIKFAIDMADGPFGSNLKAEHYTTNKEVRIVQLSNIGENGWKDENTKYTTFSHAELIKRSKVNPGDIIIAKMMPAGRSIMCPDKEKGYILSSDAVKVVVDITKAFPQFVVYAMKGKFYQRQISDQIQGSTRARTSISKLKKNTILMPSYPEQQAIASTLSLFDTHIDNLTELIEKKKAIRDGALEDLVSGKTRFAGFDGEWEEKTIDEFVKIQRGASPRPIENYLTLNAEGVNWIKIGDATKHGKYIDSTEERITPQGAIRQAEYAYSLIRSEVSG